ncbi:MAG: hypothetical protein V4732_22370 [Pseudomonadota bacterium]
MRNGRIEKFEQSLQDTFGKPYWDITKMGSQFSYTPIFDTDHVDYRQVSRFANGYNMFPDAGIESCANNISCCLTAYNEAFSAYQDTLTSLLECAEYIRKKGEDRVSREFVICIIIDGIDMMSNDFATWAKSNGIYDETVLEDSADMHIFESNLPRSRLLASLRHWNHNNQDTSLNSVTDIDSRKSLQRILMLVKTHNRGKLDSHRCFFDTICGLYHSSYFVQIDVGTVPDKEAIYHMWAELQDKPNISAVAARSHLAAPKNKADLLSLWQFCDIALERIINWPTEIFAGNLSVLPGQLSLTRIASIMPERNNKQNSGILNNYYKGLDKLGLFEANMYLAEDRVLGLEMIFENNNKWDLSYAISAEAQVDSCESWGELCRQRRRWICSSTACRIAMFGKLPQLFNNSCRTLKDKAHKLIATTYFLIYSLFEWLVPGFHMVAQATVNNLNQAAATSPALLVVHKILWGAVLISLGLQVAISLNKRLFDRSETIIRHTLNTQLFCMFAGLLAMVFSSLSNTDALAVGGILLVINLAYVGIARLYSRKLSTDLFWTIFQYSISRLSVKAFLTTYSIFNSHNTSWGTKGLEATETSNQLVSRKIFKLIKTRLPIISTFSISNLSLYFTVQSTQLLSSVATIYTLTSIILIQLCLAVPAFWYIKRNNRKQIL